MTQGLPAALARRAEIILRPEAQRPAIEMLCAAASRLAVYGVGVCTSRVELVRTLVDSSEVKVIGLVDFPWGAADADAKRFEAEVAVDLGAHEVQYVIHTPRLQDGEHTCVLREMRDVVEAADERPVTMVLQMQLLTADQVRQACEMALDAGIQGVATGLTSQSAVDPALIRNLRGMLGNKLLLKAAGRIEAASEAQSLLDAGADRLQSGEELLRLLSGP